MTQQKHFKALVRARMARTGERYATARKQLLDALARVNFEAVTEFKAHDRHCIVVRFTPDGRELLTGGFQGQARLWSTADWSPSGELVGHDASVNSVAIDRHGTRVVSASSDKTVRLWNLSTREQIAVLGRHTKQALSVDLAPASDLAATGGFDGLVRLWSLSDERELPPIEVGERITGVAFHPREPWIAVATIGSRVLVRSFEGEPIADVSTDAEATFGLRWSAEGDFLLVATSNGVVTLWASDGWDQTRRIEVGEGSMLPVVLPSDGSLIAAGWSHHIGVWRADRDEPVATVDGLPRGVYSLDFSPDGTMLAQGGRSRPCLAPDLTRFRGRRGAVPRDARSRVQRLAALIADDPRLGVPAAFAVGHDQRRSGLAREVPVTPLEQPDQHRVQLAPCLGQPVLEALRAVLVRLTLQHAVVDQRLEPVGQHVPGDRQTRGELLKAALAVERVAQHEQRPALANDVERARHRAVQIGK